MKKLNKKSKIQIIKFVIFILLIVLLLFLIKINYNDAKRKEALANTINDITTLNEKQIFYVSNIYLYSSGNAINNSTKKSMWNLDVYQFTDVAIYLSSNDNNDDSTKNKIQSIYIDDINFNNLETGTPSLYYKDFDEFGKFNIKSDNLIENSFICPSTDTPITFEYLNLVKKNCLISDIQNPLIYDGSILKRAGVNLSSIDCNLSFKMHLLTESNEKYVANISIKIPLKNETNSIYDGNFSKEISSKIPFVLEN